MFGEYGEDLNDEQQRCVHGTFVGTWWGPDYMCGACEDGATELVTVTRERWTVALSGTDKDGAPFAAEIACYSAGMAHATVGQFASVPNVTAQACVETYSVEVWVRPEDLADL